MLKTVAIFLFSVSEAPGIKSILYSFETCVEGLQAFLTIQKALNSGKRVLLKYYFMSSGLTEREISPVSLNSRYLNAFCYLRNEERQFRVGRIVSTKMLKKSVLYEKEKSKH